MEKEVNEEVDKRAGGFKRRVPIIVFIVGMVMLVAGVATLLVRFLTPDRARDAEFLVEAGEWALEGSEKCAETEGSEEKTCEPAVVWKFTEVGKGTLTTNGHINDYEFIWAIEGETLKIETAWLYDLNDEFKYELDQENYVLKLMRGDEMFTFKRNML